ncbi:Spx/MgsR family RNA polymerase-binding regulatory protein [Sphingobacterium sp. lm-10]|uniref:Spx/MgsR family RNA polymerase-binding regulatory protein n=1 Tax=Sphingobacterium sp. lm-10 TaxID=2944904 RepID=UPI002021F2D3|nr:Spx/MgsR family RNA polymerase-binding regulatory protein [Sphingobacterium sp. lm-10]MCL7987039.1 Spx/MgsR family RNA polymerase-binding regulatory protein [Sphingobacterium sp. lm-10]
MTASKNSHLNVYGIKNCSTVKKALDWLTTNEKPFVFHDFKKEPATVGKLEEWEKHVTYETLLNKKGTTWRKLGSEVQQQIVDAPSANAVLAANNSMIKRPIIEHSTGLLVGFDEDNYKTYL